MRSPTSAPGQGAEVPAERARAAVIVNPTKRGVDALRRTVRQEAERAGLPRPLWLPTTASDPGEGQARDALEAGCGAVIAAGGDGTVRAVASVLRGSGVPLGIVPVGTGNLLARNLDLPLSDVRAAVRVALTGVDRPVDVGIAETTRTADGRPGGGEADRAIPGAATEEHPFLVMAGLGFDAAMIANTRASLKKRFGWLAYVDGGMRSLPKSRGVRIRYRIDDGDERPAHVSTILIGNCGRLPGGMELLPDARLDDGLLDIAVLQPKSIWEWLLIWRKVAWENRVLRRTAIGRSVIRFTNSDRRRHISYLRGGSVRVTTRTPQPFELDGDDAGEVRAVSLRLEEGGLLVRVPRAG